jgi:hypothetical protein
MTLHHTDDSYTLLEDLWAFTKTDALLTALELGVFAQLLEQPPLTIPALAEALSVETTALEKLLVFLSNMGYMQVHAATGVVTLTPQATGVFNNAVTVQAWQAYATYMRQVQAAWQTLPTTVQHGVPTGAAFGLTEAEARFSNLNEGLRVLHAPLATALLKALQPYLLATLNQSFHWMDIGAGSGVWSLPLLEAFPYGKATLVDLPAVLAQAEQSAVLQPFNHRIQFLSADCEAPQPFSSKQLSATAYDVIIIANILRELSQEARIRLLQNAVTMLAPTGTIIIVDVMATTGDTTESTSDAVSQSTMVAASNVQLLTTSVTSSGTLTPQTLAVLLTASGIDNDNQMFSISTISIPSLQALGLGATIIQKQL